MTTAKLVDWAFLVQLMGGEVSDAVAFCRMASERLPVDVAGVEALAAAGDWETLSRRVHSLRSAVRGFGAAALGERLLAAEDRARGGEVAAVRRDLPDLMAELRRLAAELADIGERGAPEGRD